MSDPLPAHRRYTEFLELMLLSPTAKESDAIDLCDAAEQLGISRVCVNSIWINAVRQRIENTKIVPVVTVGYPLGAMMQQAAAYEAEAAFQQGAQAITMVMPQGLANAGKWAAVQNYIEAVAGVTAGTPLTVIIDPSSLHTDDQIHQACRCVWWTGATCVAAFARHDAGGADMSHFTSMDRHLRSRKVDLMAIGGVNPQNIDALLAAGVTRIGTHTSMAVELLTSKAGHSSNYGLGY